MEEYIKLISTSFNPLAVIGLIGGFLLLERFVYSRKRDKKDKGLLWLSLSFLIVVPYFMMYADRDIDYPTVFQSCFGTASSFINNVFILLAYPYFTARKTHLPNLRSTNGEVRINYSTAYPYFLLLIVGTTFIFTMIAITTALFYDWNFVPILDECGNVLFEGTAWYHSHEWPNTALSIVSLFLLGGVVTRTFQANNRPLLGLLGSITFGLAIVAQFYYAGQEYWVDILGGEEIAPLILKPLFSSIKIAYLFLILQAVAVSTDRTLEQVERSLRAMIEFKPVAPFGALGGQASYPFKLAVPRNDSINSELVEIEIRLTWREFFAYLQLLSNRYLEMRNDGKRQYVNIQKDLNRGDLPNLKDRLRKSLAGYVDGNKEAIKELIEGVILEQINGEARWRLPIDVDPNDVRTSISSFRQFLASPNVSPNDIDNINTVIKSLEIMLPSNGLVRENEINSHPALPPSSDQTSEIKVSTIVVKGQNRPT